VSGSVKIKLINPKGINSSEQNIQVKLNPFVRTDIPVSVILPNEIGGYVLVAEFRPENGAPVISRRFLKIGRSKNYSFYQINPIQK